MMSESGKAVFLSNASQDADVLRANVQRSTFDF